MSKLPTMHRKVPYNKNCLTQIVNSAKIEKLCLIFFWLLTKFPHYFLFSSDMPFSFLGWILIPSYKTLSFYPFDYVLIFFVEHIHHSYFDDILTF